MNTYKSKRISNKSRRTFLKTSSALTFTAVLPKSFGFTLALSGFEPKLYKVDFVNWSQEIKAKNVLAAQIKNEEEAELVVQWAAESGYQVRPMGCRHGWSPLVVNQITNKADKTILVDTSELNELSMVEAKPDYGLVSVGAGVLAEDLYQFLDAQRIDGGAEYGYAFKNIPAPGDITIAGALAINGHGTGVDYENTPDTVGFNGSLSNTILSFRAIMYDEATEQYKLKTFYRDEKGAEAFLTHLGRLLVVQFTLQVIPNYYLRCQSYTNIDWKQLLSKDNGQSEFSISNIMDSYGRFEIISFPFTERPWLKIWKNNTSKPEMAKATKGPYNYPFSDNIPLFFSNFVKHLVTTQ